MSESEQAKPVAINDDWADAAAWNAAYPVGTSVVDYTLGCKTPVKSPHKAHVGTRCTPTWRPYGGPEGR